MQIIEKKERSHEKNGKQLTKQPQRRERVLTFDEIENESFVTETLQHIQTIKDEVKGERLISLQEWCDKTGIPQLAMTRLLKDANLPIIKIGTFQGVYEVHISRAIYQETERQVEQQFRNRACSRVLAERQHINQNGKKGFGPLLPLSK